MAIWFNASFTIGDLQPLGANNMGSHLGVSLRLSTYFYSDAVGIH